MRNELRGKVSICQELRTQCNQLADPLMTPSTEDNRTHAVFRIVEGTPATVYEALVRPERLARWLAPQGAVVRIELFEPHPGGRFRMTLTFSNTTGKSSRHTDIVEGRFVELCPGERVVQSILFHSDDPQFAGVMTMTWHLSAEAEPEGTRVTVTAENVPRGISRADHELGMSSTLANLARFMREPGRADGVV